MRCDYCRSPSCIYALLQSRCTICLDCYGEELLDGLVESDPQSGLQGFFEDEGYTSAESDDNDQAEVTDAASSAA